MMPSCMKPLADKKTTRPPSIGALQRSRQMEGQEGVGDEDGEEKGGGSQQRRTERQ